MKKIRMSGSEAIAETLVAEGVNHVAGIVGSAFMDLLDLFPDAGIRFISVRHEQSAAHMEDGYARVTGKAGVCIGQNGPGITNMVTGVAAANMAHTPLVVIAELRNVCVRRLELHTQNAGLCFTTFRGITSMPSWKT